MHGGLWDCVVDMHDFLDENSAWLTKGLLSFIALNTVVTITQRNAGAGRGHS